MSQELLKARINCEKLIDNNYNTKLLILFLLIHLSDSDLESINNDLEDEIKEFIK